MRRVIFPVIGLLLGSPYLSGAMPLVVDGPGPRLRTDIQSADAIFLMRLENASKDAKDKRQILVLLDIFKSHPGLGNRKVFRLNREEPIAITDPQKPPTFIILRSKSKRNGAFSRVSSPHRNRGAISKACSS